MKFKTKSRTKKRFPAIRVGDKVQVIAGKDKGQTGKVLKIDWDSERLLVEGVNIVTRHQKPRNPNESGEITQSEAPIHYSNVLLFSSSAEQGVRVRTQKATDGSKQRVCVKTGNIIE